MAAFLLAAMVSSPAQMEPLPWKRERQVTSRPTGHILTNTGVWSPDGRWIVYDIRSDPSGEQFDGTRIEAVHVETGEVRILYESRRGARCGVVTFHPFLWQVVFIHGPEDPTPEWSYGPSHRQGVLVDWDRPGTARPLDGRDLTPPFTPGALRGGSHVHVFSPDGRFVSFTYEDHVLAQFQGIDEGRDPNQRNVGVSEVGRPVAVDPDHPRNHAGTAFSVLVTSTGAGSDPSGGGIGKAFEEGWIGTNGYVRADGQRQGHALAFQGHVETEGGALLSEVFVVDLPEDLSVAGEGPLEGTPLRRPFPPRGTRQRRVTFTQDHAFPGVEGPRHWLRSSPDGERIAFLKKDRVGVVQLWTVAPRGDSRETDSPTSDLRQLTSNPLGIASAFTWSWDGRWIAHAMDNSVCVTDAASGVTHRLTPRSDDASAPRPEAMVFAPGGKRIAYVRRVPQRGDPGRIFNQIFVVEP